LKDAVSASANLARGIADGTSAVIPLDKKSEKWIESSKAGLLLAVEKTGYQPKDRNGENIPIHSFIEERFKEVKKGVELSLDKNIEGPSEQIIR
jgi:hypothetical protein